MRGILDLDGLNINYSLIQKENDLYAIKKEEQEIIQELEAL